MPPLIERRKQAGLSQAELAEKVGQSQSWVSRLETGEANFFYAPFVVALRVADALKRPGEDKWAAIKNVAAEFKK